MPSSDVGAKISKNALQAITEKVQWGILSNLEDFYGQPMPAGGIINDKARCMEIVRKALEEIAGVTIEVAP